MNKQEAESVVSSVTSTYDKIAKHFSLTRYKLWGDLEYFKQYIQPGQAILDAGCGNARVLELFATLPIQYTGFDVSNELLEEAKKKITTLPIHKDTTVQFFVDSLTNPQHVTGEYDHVFCIAVLHHIPQPLQEQVIATLMSHVKPGGYLMVSVWNMYQSKMIGTWLKCQWEKMISPKKYGMTIPWYKYSLKDMFVVYKGTGENIYRYIHGYTKRSLQKLLSPHGTIEMISYVRNEEKVGMFSGKNIIAIVKK